MLQAGCCNLEGRSVPTLETDCFDIRMPGNVSISYDLFGRPTLTKNTTTVYIVTNTATA